MNTKVITRVAMYTALTCAAAVLFRYLPAVYIPYSILPLMALLAGFILGAKNGALSMTLYMLIGLLGIPVFTYGGGIQYALKPSFGFIPGFILAAYTVGKVLELRKNPGLIWSSVAVLSGLASLYALGLSYFYLILNFILATPASVMRIIELGFKPYIALDLIKGVGALLLGRILLRAMGQAGILEKGEDCT